MNFRRWSFDSDERKFKPIEGEFDESRLGTYLQTLDWFEDKLGGMGVNITERTAYNRRKLTYLYTWVHTDEAMIMLLSNMTLQVISEKIIGLKGIAKY